MSFVISEQEIRARAYALWVAADKPEGSSLRFWKEAEAELTKARSKLNDAADQNAEPLEGRPGHKVASDKQKT